MDRLEQAASALSVLDPTDRDVWIRMAGALSHEFGDAAYSVWEQWSRRDTRPPPHGFMERSARTTWRSMGKPSGKVARIGSLFYEAKAAGWEPGAEMDYTPRQPSESEQKRDEREAAHAKKAAAHAATSAQEMLDGAEYQEHPYLATKGFPEAKGPVLERFTYLWVGIMQDGRLRSREWDLKNVLVAPMRHAKTDVLQTAQLIDAEGGKKFLAKAVRQRRP